jgi:hypothetical protein
MARPTQSTGKHPSIIALLLLLLRRFKDFDSLNTDVCENFRGHQLFSRSHPSALVSLLTLLSTACLPSPKRN